MAIVIPDNLRRLADYGEPEREWLAALPETVTELAERWSLRLGAPYRPGGSAAWVAPVTGADGSRAVLKVAWRHYEARDEAAGLRFWSGRGVVEVLQSEVYEQTTAMLLEECRPGTTLAAALPPPERDEVIARILKRLWTAPPPGAPFRPLAGMCEAWAAGFAERSPVPPDQGLMRLGLDLWKTLPTSATTSVLLCTDLHPDNVLSAEREPWLVVDPKPYIGDPAYDPIQHMLNFPDRLATAPAAFATRMATLLDLDPLRVRQWLLARCTIESQWPVAKALSTTVDA
ncbi:aminoglycoside phosphotransferase family protein [Actinoplanes sp. NPDC049265]|uniref:aminoglycoside phosphotransferase family protein n=1 Tax=Actinoplanes sp. NPDC049265 TaxID=3363902 RepID=UPI0037235F29